MKIIKKVLLQCKNHKPFSIRDYNQGISILLLLAFLNLVISCNSYYKVRTELNTDSLAAQLQNNKKYFIIHQGLDVWHLKNISMIEERNEISGIIEPLPVNHQNYETTNPKSSYNKYKPRYISKNPTVEVHLYISESEERQDSQIIVPLASIHKIEIYDKAVGETVFSHVIGAIGVIGAAIVVLTIIVLLTKSSCPFAYVYNGHSFQFTGELYGGAIYSSLERDDYLPIPDINPVKGECQIKIANELLERQYTNLAELMVVEHPQHSKVLIDRYGHIHTMIQPEAPYKAISDRNMDYVPSILAKDSSHYMFNDENTTNKDLSSLTMSFKKPVDSNTGKLILNARNSFWLDYIYGKFNEQFGTYFNKFSEDQKNVPAQKINQWSLDQGIPLSVYVYNESGWKFVDYFNVIGPLASRDMVMPVDLSQVKGDQVMIRIECGFMFWELDYVAMDFSENIPATIALVGATSATDENGLDVSSLISSTDVAYLVQPEVGNEVIINYSFAPPGADNLQSIFLHSRGYYEYIRDYRTEPHLMQLSSFKKKGSFARFSKEHYSEFVGDNYFLDNTITASDAK